MSDVLAGTNHEVGNFLSNHGRYFAGYYSIVFRAGYTQCPFELGKCVGSQADGEVVTGVERGKNAVLILLPPSQRVKTEY